MRAHLIAECHKHGPGFQFSIRASTAAGSDFQTCIASLEDHLQSGIGQKVLAGPLVTRLLPTLALQADADLEEAFAIEDEVDNAAPAHRRFSDPSSRSRIT